MTPGKVKTNLASSTNDRTARNGVEINYTIHDNGNRETRSNTS